jgi:hypothetical protein
MTGPQVEDDQDKRVGDRISADRAEERRRRDASLARDFAVDERIAESLD